MTRSLASTASVEGLCVVVTGGNGGIGLGIARGLLLAGARVVVWGRNTAKNEAALESLGMPDKTAAFACDVSDEDQVDQAFQQSLDWAGGAIHAMFANAAVPGQMQPFVDLSLEDWHAPLRTNLDGAFLSLRAVTRHLVERGEGGALVGISSVSNFYGTAEKQPYGVSKAGIEALMRSLAVELAPHGIRANTMLPGWTDTPLLAPGAGFLPDSHHELIRKQTIRRTPAGRWADPDEFGAAAVFLADPALTFHTGDRMVVDGAYTIF